MMRHALAWGAAVLGLALAAVTAYAAYELASYSWNQVVSYKSPYVAAGFDRGDGNATTKAVRLPSTTRRRVVLVIIDGLRLDASKKMQSMEGLRAYGTDAVARTGQPSLSYPTWTTILTGTPQRFSGVTTNWYKGPVPIETIMDVARAEGARVAVAAPTDFDDLYEVKRVALASALHDWSETEYLASWMVDSALRLSKSAQPDLLVVHIPDVDEAGHSYGGASPEYAAMVARVDADLERLVEGMRDGRTAFVVTADHGHVDAGGHGGWEPVVTRVPFVAAGAGVGSYTGELPQDDIAPTVAAMLGLPGPASSLGSALAQVSSDASRSVLARIAKGRDAALLSAARVVSGASALPRAKNAQATLDAATARRLAVERRERLPLALALLAGALGVLVVIGASSWRALAAAGAGAATYYAVYDGLYFLIHGYRWSLSAFNSEDKLQLFFNMRMVESASAALIGAVVAALVYTAMRENPKGPRSVYLAGWLGLGIATVLVIQATLAVQVAWFLWAYGARVTWLLPDFGWGFKYDLDLIQLTALGAAAVLAPVVTYLVGRYHPRVRRAERPVARP